MVMHFSADMGHIEPEDCRWMSLPHLAASTVLRLAALGILASV